MFLRRLHGPVLLGFPTCSHLTDFILLFKTLKAYRRKTELSKKRPITTTTKKKIPLIKLLNITTVLCLVKVQLWVLFKCVNGLNASSLFLSTHDPLRFAP